MIKNTSGYVVIAVAYVTYMICSSIIYWVLSVDNHTISQTSKPKTECLIYDNLTPEEKALLDELFKHLKMVHKNAGIYIEDKDNEN